MWARSSSRVRRWSRPRDSGTWRRGSNPGGAAFDWCLGNRVYPSHVVWQTEVGSPWADRDPPPTEYFLMIDTARHDLMVKYGLEKAFNHYYFRAQAWQTGCDWRRLVDRCECENCA